MELVKIIKSYVGQQDKDNSTDFPDTDFKKKLVDAGWTIKVRWCCYFAKMVWKEYYKNNPEMIVVLDMLFKDRIIDTFEQFEDNEMFTVSFVPVPGAIALYKWEGVRKAETGTTLMVTGVGDRFFTTTELQKRGNSLQVVESKRKMNKQNRAIGLNLLGFIHPIILKT